MIDTKKVRDRLYGMDFQGEDMAAFKRLFNAFVDLLEEVDRHQFPDRPPYWTSEHQREWDKRYSLEQAAA